MREDEVSRNTVEQFKKPVVSTNNWDPSASESSEDGPPWGNSVKKNTVSQQQSISPCFQQFIEGLPHFEPIHYAFRIRDKDMRCCICSWDKSLAPWREDDQINLYDEEMCKTKPFNYNGLISHTELKFTLQPIITFDKFLPTNHV
jgi:hypothetical protein